MTELRGEDFLYHLPKTVKDDMLLFLCGKELGRGVSRTTFVCEVDDTCVVKIEHDQSYNQNACEYSIWQAVRNLPIGIWFAKVHMASPMNSMILQSRTQPVTLAELQKKCPKVPAFFSDLKVGNWGRVGRRYVCHDYGTALTPEIGINNGSRLKLAKWWE